MKGSPIKLGKIQGTAEHTSALKQKEAKESALKNVQYFGEKTSHEEVKRVNEHNKDVDFKTGKHSGPKMKSPMKDLEANTDFKHPHVKPKETDRTSVDHHGNVTYKTHATQSGPKMKSPMKDLRYTSDGQYDYIHMKNQPHDDGGKHIDSSTKDEIQQENINKRAEEQSKRGQEGGLSYAHYVAQSKKSPNEMKSPMKDKKPDVDGHNQPGEEEWEHNVAKHPHPGTPPGGDIKEWKKRSGVGRAGRVAAEAAKK